MKSDDPAVCWEANAEAWTRLSWAGYDVYRDSLNTPAFLAMLPPVAGLSGLDVGCGEGSNTRRVAALGARMAAVDISPTFIRHAAASEREEPLGVDYRVADALALPFADASFDFVVAFMSMMDVGDPLRGLAEAARVLRPGGFVQFSILHPCFAPPHRKVLRDDRGRTAAVAVAEYFATGGHVEEWSFGSIPEAERADRPFRVPYVHLTLSQWLNGLNDIGLAIDRLGEPSASAETAARVPDVADTRVAPLFLHVRAVKPAAAVRRYPDSAINR